MDRPIKKINEFMAEDHKRLDDLLRNFQRTKSQDQSRARELFHEFRILLLRHLHWEEQILLPTIEARQCMHMPGPSTITRLEHQQIKELLETAYDHVVRQQRWADPLEKQLVEMLEAHTKEEERILYPWIDLSLSEEEKEEALEKMKHSAAETD